MLQAIHHNSSRIACLNVSSTPRQACRLACHPCAQQSDLSRSRLKGSYQRSTLRTVCVK